MAFKRLQVDRCITLRPLVHWNPGNRCLSPDSKSETEHAVETGRVTFGFIDCLGEFLDLDGNIEVRIGLDPELRIFILEFVTFVEAADPSEARVIIVNAGKYLFAVDVLLST